eukprot:875617_1
MALEEKATFEAKVHYILQHISSNHELLVNGYCRDVMVNIPKEIINYCIVFAFFAQDKFDIKNIGKYHTLNGNVITQNTQDDSSSFLSNTLSDGKHIWTFKIKSKYCRSIILGIWKVKSDKPPTDHWFCSNNNGYGYVVGDGYDHNVNKYGIKCK